MYLHLIDIFLVLIGNILWRGEINMIFSSFSLVEGRGQNTTNESRDEYYGCHVTVYKFALGLFGLEIDK